MTEANPSCQLLHNSCKVYLPAQVHAVALLYMQGYGDHQSDTEAEKWWLLAAKHGGDASSVRAQNTLGMFYAREESRDLGKVWWRKGDKYFKVAYKEVIVF